MFYDKFCELCDAKHISCKKAAMEIGLSGSTAAKWKKTGATPNSDTLLKISEYFGIPISTLLETEKATAPKSDGLDMDAILESMTDEQLIRFIKKASALLSDKE